MTSEDYVHPASGRTYHEDDPAHYFALLVAGLARQCSDFLYHYERRLKDRDYLQQYGEWLSDPSSIARTMADTIERLDKAYTAVTCDRTLHQYGLAKQDDEWHRKYGDVSP